MQETINVNGRGFILSAIALGTLGVLSFIVQPALVQGFVSHLGLTEADAVGLAGIEMLGVALATIALALPFSGTGWRALLAWGIALAVIGNLASAALVGTPWLWAARLVAGLGHGAVISLSFTFIALTRRVDRNLAWYLVSLLSYGAVGVWVMPALLDRIGMAGLMLAFAALMACGFATLRFVPQAGETASPTSPSAAQLATNLQILGLGGVLAYNMAQGIAWAILFLVGTGAGLAEGDVAQALFISQIIAILGALGSVFLAERLDRLAALLVGIVAGTLCIALLLGTPSYTIYLLAICGFNLLWNFTIPFMLGAVSDFDTRGRMMSAAIAMQMLGLGGGPLLASALIGDGDYRMAELACIGFFLASLVLLVVPVLRHRRMTSA